MRERRLQTLPRVMHPTVGGQFLTPDDINDGAIVKIIAAGEYKPSTWNPNRLELPIIPHRPPKWTTGSNEEKTWGLNPTSEATICSGVEDGAAGYGETTEAWIGRLAKISKVKQMVGKDLKTVLYGEPVEASEQPKTQAKIPTGTPTSGVPTITETPIYNEAEKLYLRYNTPLIGTTLDPQDWQAMPKGVKQSLQEKEVLIVRDGYPFLTELARKALD